VDFFELTEIKKIIHSTLTDETYWSYQSWWLRLLWGKQCNKLSIGMDYFMTSWRIKIIYLTSYYESYCGRANGSGGELFSPEREKTKISVFVPEVCRTKDLSFEEEVNRDGKKDTDIGKVFLNQTSSEDNWYWANVLPMVQLMCQAAGL